MLIDWVTVRIGLEHLTAAQREACAQLGDRICRYCPQTGEVRYEMQSWDSIRSDTHQISIRCTTDLWIQGSPARLMADGDAVFGAGASRALDLRGCVGRMIQFVGDYLGTGVLPSVESQNEHGFPHWIVSRIDVTGNLMLGSQQQVFQALEILRNCEGGRYKVSQQKGETVYWSHGSKHRSGKAYAKGQHLATMQKKPDYTGRVYTAAEIEAARRLLRLELSLKREFLNRHNWHSLTPADLESQWRDYFERMIGGAEMRDDADLKTRIINAAPSEGQGKAAFGCWSMIQAQGWEHARDCYSKPTWYRHLKVLRSAGLGDADISAGKVVALRQKIIEAQLVSNWQQAAAA